MWVVLLAGGAGGVPPETSSEAAAADGCLPTNGLMNLNDADRLLAGSVRVAGGTRVELGSGNVSWAQTSLDTQSAGVSRQNELRDGADDDGYAEPNLWTGVGRARSGAGAAIVGDPDQVVAKLKAYQEVGVEAFILSGYTHIAECDLVAEHVLPNIEHSALRPRWS